MARRQKIILPERTDSQIRRAFQLADQQLERMDVPVLDRIPPVQAIEDGKQFLHMRDGVLREYTRCGNKLYYTELKEA